jgi:hypothetical protein
MKAGAKKTQKQALFQAMPSSSQTIANNTSRSRPRKRQAARPLFIATMLSVCAPLAFADTMDVDTTARLIRKAEKVPGSEAWAADLLDVLRQHGLDRSRENVCATIAIIDQESGFVADPAVPGLGKLSEEALRQKFAEIPVAGGMALRFLEKNPSPDDSYMLRIRRAKTERDLDLAYRQFVEDISASLGIASIVNSGLFNSIVNDRNEIDTAGSMQVSVKFALKTANDRRWFPMSLADTYAVRDQLYSRKGGMYYGVKLLLDYDTGYSKKVHRFADFNAGRYASRNAAFQKIISTLSKTRLDLDGDLLIYDKGEPSSKASATESALRQLAADFAQLRLSEKEIRLDLNRAQDEDFTETKTFNRIRDLYRARTGKEPPFAVLPEIVLNSPKIRRRMTTADFATRVDKRYQACMTG